MSDRPIHPALPQPPEQEREQTAHILAAVRKHRTRVSSSASPGHWSYEAKRRGEGDWFAHCSCGWTSEPHNYETREGAWLPAHAHLATKIKEAL